MIIGSCLMPEPTDNHDNLAWVLDRLLLAADAVQAAQREAGASVNGKGIVTLQLVIESQALIRHPGSGLGSPTRVRRLGSSIYRWHDCASMEDKEPRYPPIGGSRRCT
jgi:hypothetical protein